MHEIPDSIKEINKKLKTNKISTLSKAKSVYLKRYFSGSFSMDRLLGGGFAYKRILMLFGSKSCIDGDSFLYYEVWKNDKRINSKGGTIQRLYERFTGDTEEGSKYGRHLQDNSDVTFYVKSVDDTNRVMRNEVLDVVKTGIKECFLVKTKLGNELTSTKEHKYLTPTGYKKLSELKVDDIVFINTNNRVKGRKPNSNRPTLCVKYHPNFPVKIVKDTYKDKTTDYIYYRGQISRIAYEAFLNDMKYDEYVNFLNTKSKEEINKLNFLPKNIHVHHKDENYLNNDISNLELIDPSEHGKLHMQDRLSNLQIIVEETQITSIEYVGERVTYDIKCAYPYNNYIANGIVVHNSGKNALLNQTTAYQQRLCRNCKGIHPYYYEQSINDKWTLTLKHILNIKPCKCKNPETKRVLFVDYEDNLSMEEPQVVIVREFTDKSGAIIDELDYNTTLAKIDILQKGENLSDEEKSELKSLEKWVKSINIKESEVIQLPTQDFLKLCGVNTNELLLTLPETTEEGIEIIKPIIESRDVDMIIWDSLQGAVPKYIKDREAEQMDMGAEAKANGKLMRYVVSSYAPKDIEDEMEAYKPTLFITSQVRASLGGFHAGPDSYSGGNSVAHHNAAIIEIKRDNFLKEDGSDASFKDNFYGQRTRIRADKNKLAAPGDMYNYDFYFRQGDTFDIGIDHVGEIINLGILTGNIEQAGAYFKVMGESIQGKIKLNRFLRDNPEFIGELYSKIIS